MPDGALIPESRVVIFWNDTPTGSPEWDVLVRSIDNPDTLGMNYDNSAGANEDGWLEPSGRDARSVFWHHMASKDVVSATPEFWVDIYSAWLNAFRSIAELSAWARESHSRLQNLPSRRWAFQQEAITAIALGEVAAEEAARNVRRQRGTDAYGRTTDGQGLVMGHIKGCSPALRLALLSQGLIAPGCDHSWTIRPFDVRGDRGITILEQAKLAGVTVLENRLGEHGRFSVASRLD